MMTLTLAAAQAQSISTSYVVLGMGLLILVLLLLMYLLMGEKNNGLLPINQHLNKQSIKKAKRIFLPYTERFAEDIASGDKVYIQGKLSRNLQLGLKTIFWLLYSAIGVALILNMLNSTELWYMPLVFALAFAQYLKLAYVLKRAKRNTVQYYPQLPKQQPYFDYKGERITAKLIKEWQSTVYVWLPVSLLVFAMAIISSYNLYFK